MSDSNFTCRLERYLSEYQVKSEDPIAEKADRIIAEYREFYTPETNNLKPEEASGLLDFFEARINYILKTYRSPQSKLLYMVREILYDLNTALTDQRRAEQVIYPLDALVLITFLAKACGCKTAEDIVYFYRERNLELQLLLPNMPSSRYCVSESTINTVLRMIPRKEMEAVVAGKVSVVCATLKEMMDAELKRGREPGQFKETVGFDGQELKASFRRGESSRKLKAAHSVTVFNCTLNSVLGYKTVSAKNQESIAFLNMLPELDVRGKVVMCDALNSRAGISKAILSRHADYLLNIKNNGGNKELLNHVEAVFNREHAKSDSKILSVCHTEKGHGRIDSYNIQILPGNKLNPRIKCVHEKVRTIVCCTKISQRVSKSGKTAEPAVNIRYYVSSLKYSELTAEQILFSVLDYWAIEAHHGILDDENVFAQDSIQSCNENYLGNIAGINKIAYNLLSWKRTQMTLESNKKTKVSYAQAQRAYADTSLMRIFFDLMNFYAPDSTE